MAGSIETMTISASDLKLKLKLTEAELGKNPQRKVNEKTEKEFSNPPAGIKMVS